jgi:hypothetical protein
MGLLAVSRTGEDFDQGVECREVHVPSSMVSVQVVQFAPGLFCVLLGVGPEFVEESFRPSLCDSVPLRWLLVGRCSELCVRGR